MTAARTLLQLAGADATPGPLTRSAVVVIDAQREYVDGRLPLPGAAPALDVVHRLLVRARAAGAPVIHVAHQGKAGGLFDPEGTGGQIADPARPEPGEVVIAKGMPNAFAGTDLHAVLKETGRTSVILAGFMTHMCVSSTARAAVDLGYRITVIADGTATRALPDPTGGLDIDAAMLQRSSLAELADRFAVVAPLSALAS